MSQFNVLQGDDANAVYLGFVWELCGRRSMYVVPAGVGAFGAREFGVEYELVKWEFEVELEHGAKLGDVVGFIPARTASHWHVALDRDACEPSVELVPEEVEELESMKKLFEAVGTKGVVAPDEVWAPSRPPGWNRSWLTHAALYSAETFEALRSLQSATLADAASSIDVYAVSPDRHAQLVEVLRADDPPRMEDLLGPGDIFVSLNLGIDMDYSDVLLVQTTSDVGDEIDTLATRFDARIAEYEAEIDAVADMSSLLAALARLAGVAG